MDVKEEPQTLNHHFYSVFSDPSLSLCRKANLYLVFDENLEVVSSNKTSFTVIYCSRSELMFTNFCVLPRPGVHPRTLMWISHERPIWLMNGKQSDDEPPPTVDLPRLNPGDRHEVTLSNWIRGHYIGLRVMIPEDAPLVDDPLIARIMTDTRIARAKEKATPHMESLPQRVAGADEIEQQTESMMQKKSERPNRLPRSPYKVPQSAGIGARRIRDPLPPKPLATAHTPPESRDKDEERDGSSKAKELIELFGTNIGPILLIGYEAASVHVDTVMREMHTWKDRRSEGMALRLERMTLAAGGGASHSTAEGSWQEIVERGDITALEHYLQINPTVDMNAEWNITRTTSHALPEYGSAVHYAATVGNIPLLHYLIGRGANINSTSGHSNETALHFAAKRNRVEAATALITGGAEINARATGSITPIIAAAQRGHLEMVDLLLKHKADLRVVSIIGSVLPVALTSANMVMCRRLMQAGAPMDSDSPVCEPLLKDFSFIKMLLRNQKYLHPSLTGTMARVTGLLSLAKLPSTYFSWLSPDLLEHMLTYVLHLSSGSLTSAPAFVSPSRSASAPIPALSVPLPEPATTDADTDANLLPPLPSIALTPVAPPSPFSFNATNLQQPLLPPTASSSSSTFAFSAKPGSSKENTKDAAEETAAPVSSPGAVPYQFAPPSPLSSSGLASGDTFSFGKTPAMNPFLLPTPAPPTTGTITMTLSAPVFSVGSSSTSPTKKSPTNLASRNRLKNKKEK